MRPYIVTLFNPTPNTRRRKLYAALASFRALQSDGAADDKQWLTFWLLFTLFEVGISVLDVLAIYIVPFYGELKVRLT